MAEKRYRVITNGRPARGQKPDDVIKRLSMLFKLPPEKVKGLLAGKVQTVRKGLDEQTARRMLAALKKAGLICKAEPEGGHRPPSSLKPSPSEGAAPDVRAALEARTIDPAMGSTAIEHTAMASSEITPSAGGGLDFHKPGARDVPFSQVLLMAVYEPPSALGGETKLMVFTSGSKRPLALNASSIKYWQFQGISSSSAGLSLRQFIAYVYARTPSVMLDAPTSRYLDGSLPRQLDVDESILSSALGKALAFENLFAEPVAGMAKSRPGMEDILSKLKQASSPEPEKVARGRARMALSATAVSMAWMLWTLYGQLGLLRLYDAYFDSSNHPVINHILMWASVAALLTLAVYSALVLKRIRGWSPVAQGSFRLYAWALGAFTALRFVLLWGLALGLRRGIISGGFALDGLREVLGSQSLLLSALLLSPAGIAVPALIITVRLFSSSWEVKSRFGG
jgi:hypothetical protein